MIYIVTEGPFDQKLVEVVLRDLYAPELFVIKAYGGKNNARPTARKHLLQHKSPVIFIIDADTSDPDKAKEEQEDLEYYFGMGGQSMPFQVTTFVPTIEVVFFEKPVVIERLLGRPLDRATKIAGRVAPKEILESLLPELKLRTRADIIERLTEEDLREIRSQQQMAAIRQFIECQSPVKMAV